MARSGFEVQKVTVEALFLREIRTRFGKFRLGYLWAIRTLCAFADTVGHFWLYYAPHDARYLVPGVFT